VNRKGDKAPEANRALDKPLFIGYGIFMVIVGFALTYLGIRLAIIGGSWYYLLAGLATTLAGVQVIRLHVTGAYIIGALSLLTLAWSWWEVGYNGWAMIPRLDWIVVLGIMLLAALRPAQRTLKNFRKRSYVALTAVPSIAGLLSILVPLLVPQNVKLAEPELALKRPVEPFSRQQVNSPDSNVAANHDETNWTAYAGSNLSNHYSPAKQINAQNVGRLEKAWEYHTGDLPAPGSKIPYLSENTPLKVGSSVYVCTPSQQVIALDAGTGKEKWRFDPKANPKALETAGAYCRGVAYFEVPTTIPVENCRTRIIWGVTGGRMAAVDAETGESCKGFAENGFVDLSKGIGNFAPGYWGNTSAPIVIRGNVIIGHMVRDGQDRYAPSGVVRAYDAVTGKFAWAWDLGNPGVTTEPGPDEHYTPGTPNVWAPITGDDELGLIYVGTGNASGDFYGSTRSEAEEEYTSAIVALDAKTGLEKWHFRTVNHDLWDFDIGPQPNLVDWPTKTGMRPAVVQATKSGQIFVLDRETGEPLMPVEHLPVPQGADGGNWTAATQPFSTGMPNTVGAPSKKARDLTESDAWGISPFDQAMCRIQYRSLRYDGMFTPPMTTGTLAYPGNHGGLNWGGVAIDVHRGIMTMNTNNLPYVERVISREEIDAKGSRSLNQGGGSKGLMPQVGLPMGAEKAPWLSSLGVPCISPPWGYLSGVDLRTTDVIWQRPLGSGYDTGPLGIPSRVKLDMGTPSDGGPLITGGGVTFVGATLDYFMRAFDSQTGQKLWETRLPAGAQGAPMTYVHNGEQYIVAVVGGHQRLGTKIGDSVIAWKLSK